jgi:hypothetical protein
MADTFPTRMTDRQLIVKPKNTRKKHPHPKTDKTNFNTFFIITSNEKFQLHAITIFPTGMSATCDINLVCCEVFFSISGDAMKPLQHLLASNSLP